MTNIKGGAFMNRLPANPPDILEHHPPAQPRDQTETEQGQNGERPERIMSREVLRLSFEDRGKIAADRMNGGPKAA
jgi:hypothetical protein